MIPNGSQSDLDRASGQVWSFGGCEFDDSRLELRVAGNTVELELKPLEVLLELLRHSGAIVEKDRLLEAVWPGLLVVDGSLATAVSKLRKVLDAAGSEIIVTIPRVGYRIGVPVSSRTVVSTPSAPEFSLRAGELVPGRPHWRLLRPLAQPESRAVWLAQNPKTHELRVFKFSLAGSRLRNLKREVTVSRFLAESLGPRPDLARLLEWNFDSKPYFIESEYAGVNLAEWAESQGGLGNLAVETRVRLIAQIAKTVAAAHRAGVVHRDLKPTNILVAPVPGAANFPWQIKVMDFGSASVIEPERLHALGITSLGLTQTADSESSSLSGTLLYLPPEVLAGKPATAAGDVYALGVILYQALSGDFRRPLAAGWESTIEDSLLREDVGKAAHGDPSQRLTSAAELAERLARLEQRRAERANDDLAREKRQRAVQKAAEARARRPWVIVATAALAIAFALGLGFYRKVFSSSPLPRSVAILPFQNTASDPSMDFLRFALADEVATTLNHMRPLTIRPLASAAQYSGASVDLQQAGRALSASTVVAGHYLKVGDQLQVSMEAVDVVSNQVLWRDTINVPANNLLAMQTNVSAITQGKLAPALGAATIVREAIPPKNEQAYALYLQSLPLTSDETQIKQALQLLRRSVELDPNFAQAWAAISNRSYAASRFGRGGRAMLDQSDAAAKRALALDPDHLEAALILSQNLAERGDLVNAYQHAKTLVDRRPDSAGAHHELGYVLRYAGLLDESGRQCDLAVLLDPQVLWAPCSSTFMEAGNYRRAMDFIRKDFSTEWSKAHAIEIFVRDGQESRALQFGAPKIPLWDSYKMLLACVAHRPQSEISALAQNVPVDDDPEVVYFVAGHFAYCGQKAQAFQLLRSAVEANYCSYPALDRDPMFASVRNDPEFKAIRSQAMACQKSFLNALSHPVQ
ncbi:MAG TPA: winged helix-turn-helix domain-containing protein [Candidatus Acidoferrum sp.]|jgi:serine/threonine protein kinase/DNA-binding winged helix-turn-helix (wHTH) protein